MTISTMTRNLPIVFLLAITAAAAAQSTRPTIATQPYTFNPRQTGDSLIDLSFLHPGPAGREGFVRVQNAHLVKGDGSPLRLWGFCLTEWSPGSMEIPPKTDAPIYAAALSRFGVNYVRLHFLDLPAPRGMIDATRFDSQHFNPTQLDNEDFFISEMINRGIYVDMNLNVGRMFKPGDDTVPGRMAKGPLLFDKRLIELEKDYAKQLLTHVNPYTKRAYIDEPGMAVVEIVNEDSIYVGWSSNNSFDQELTDLYNAWLIKNLTPDKLADLRKLAGVAADKPVPRLRGREVGAAPKERYYTESDFFSDLESGFFKDMSAYLRTLGAKCPIIATADHSHSGSGYPLVKDASQLDALDGHTYWQHPSERPRNAPMVNDPFDSTVVELSRTPMAGKPYTVSEVNHPFPNQFACEGIPILAAYAGFQDWDGVVWYTFEQKRDPNWKPYIGDPFDMSLDPIKMPQIMSGALMFERGDVAAAKQTVSRNYSKDQVYDSRLLPRTDRPYFTPGFPLSVPLLHESRIGSLAGPPTATFTQPAGGEYRSDTGQLVWYTNPTQTGLVTIDTPRSQGLVGFVKANHKSVTHLAADVKNDFCAIVLTSLDDQPIAACSRMLLTAGDRVVNTGMTLDPTGVRVIRRGVSPTLIQPVTGKIFLRNINTATNITVTPLDGTGKALGSPIIASNSSDGWQFPVGDPATTWYLLQVMR
jgi:hypothetical protein